MLLIVMGLVVTGGLLDTVSVVIGCMANIHFKASTQCLFMYRFFVMMEEIDRDDGDCQAQQQEVRE